MTTPLDDATLTAFLEGQESAWLAEQLMLIADEDPLVRIRLTAAAGSEKAVDEARDAVLTGVADHLPEDPTEGADALHRVLDVLDDLVDYGFEDESADIADEARELYLRLHGEDDSEHLARLHTLADGEEDED